MNSAGQNDAMVVDDNVDPAKATVPQLLRDLLLKLSVVRAIALRGHMVTFGSHLSILKRILPNNNSTIFADSANSTSEFFLEAHVDSLASNRGFNRAVCVPVLVEMQARMYLFL
jgi:hypothetical protein